MSVSAQPLSRKQYLVCQWNVSKLEPSAERKDTSVTAIVREVIETHDPERQHVLGEQELMLDTLKPMDEVKRRNRDIERLDQHVVDVDKRIVRLETMMELAQRQKLPRKE